MCKLCEELGLNDQSASSDKVGVSPSDIVTKHVTEMSNSLEVSGGKEAWIREQQDFLDSRAPGLAEAISVLVETNMLAERFAELFGKKPSAEAKLGVSLALARSVIDAVDAAEAAKQA